MNIPKQKQIMQLAVDTGHLGKKEALKILNTFKFGRLKCELCHKPLRRCSIDHIIPKSKGGGDELFNLRLTHSTCNSIRGTEFKIRDLICLLF